MSFKTDKELITIYDRNIVDYAIELGETVSPTGQSGNVMSPFYADEAEMYATGKFRKMLMNREAIKKVSRNKLILKPQFVNDCRQRAKKLDNEMKQRIYIDTSVVGGFLMKNSRTRPKDFLKGLRTMKLNS